VTLALSRELSELTPGTTYTVSYDGNLGTGTVPSSSVTEGDSCTAAANGFTRSGYEFAGWATSAAGAAVYKPRRFRHPDGEPDPLRGLDSGSGRRFGQFRAYPDRGYHALGQDPRIHLD